jgi:hypothetical protein
MRNLIIKFQSYWLADASFVTLLIMLDCRSIRTPGSHGNQRSRSPAVQRTFAQRVSFRDLLDAQRWSHIRLRNFCSHSPDAAADSFGENPYSFFVLENVIGIANTLVFIFINLRLLFRDQIVNTYRIIGAVNVYLLLALIGALTLEVIHAATGASIGGNVVLSGTDDDYVHFIYFSLASLTTVGFGDIFAVNTSAKMLATLLSTLGVLFPAIVIARLVGLASSQR